MKKLHVVALDSPLGCIRKRLDEGSLHYRIIAKQL
jgi:hypothetical protein